MLKKFFSSKKKKEEETENEAPPPISKAGGKIVIKKRTPSKVQTNFVPSTEPFDPTEETILEPDVPFSDESQEQDGFEDQLVTEEETFYQEQDPPKQDFVEVSRGESNEFDNDINALEQQLGTLDAEREQLSSDLEVAQKVIQDLRLQLGEKDNLNSELESQLTKQADQLKTYQESEDKQVVESLSEQLATQEKIIAKLKEDRNLALDEVQDLNKEKEDLINQLANFKDSTLDVSKEKKEAESEIQILQAMVKRLEGEQQEIEDQYREQLQQVSQQNELLTKEVSEFKINIEKLEEQVQNLDVEKVALEKQEKVRLKKIEEQTKALSDLRKEKDSLFKSLKDLESGKDSDQSLVEHAQQEIDKLKKAEEDKQVKIESLQEQLKSEQKMVAEAEGKVRKVEKDLEKKQQELDTQLQKNQEQAATLKTEKDQIKKLQKKITTLETENQQVAFFAKQVDELNAEIEKANAIQNELQGKLAEVKTAHKDTIKEHLQVSKEFEKISEKYNAAHQELEALKEDIKSKKKESEAAGKEIVELKENLKTAENKVDQLSKELEKLRVDHDIVVKREVETKKLSQEEKLKLEADLKIKLAEIEKLSIELKQAKEDSSRLNSENADLGVEVAKLNKQLIQTATKLAAASVAMEEKENEEQRLETRNEKEKEVPVSREEILESTGMPESLTVNVSIIPQGDEFELEVPADITGMNIISELIDAGVLNEDMNFAINIKRTGEAIGGDDTLYAMGVRDDDLIIIDTA